jgi:hypothetical protein
MRLMRWLKGEPSRDRVHRRPRKAVDESEKPKGDFRGSYGFGRRSHVPDPQGHYVFENDAHRPRRNPDDR